MSTDFERYILAQRPFCEVTDCMRASRYVIELDGGRFKAVCAHHDPDFCESFSAWLTATGQHLEPGSFSEWLANAEDSI